jgi:hypothetical protein
MAPRQSWQKFNLWLMIAIEAVSFIESKPKVI